MLDSSKTKVGVASLIVTTKNEVTDIQNCLKSLQKQDYSQKEVILIDNNSTDGTPEAAAKLDVTVKQKGPERSAQRNYGFEVASGEFVCFLDADMIAPPNMVKECVDIIKNTEADAIVIPEISFGNGFWTQCKILERSCYPPGSFIEAARFYKAETFCKLNGFDEEMTGLEDLDLHQRCDQQFKIAHSKTPIRHHEGTIRFLEQLTKKFYYGRLSWKYARKHPRMFRKQGNPFRGYFFNNWKRLTRTPIMTLAMITLKSCELTAGGLGVLFGMIQNKDK